MPVGKKKTSTKKATGRTAKQSPNRAKKKGRGNPHTLKPFVKGDPRINRKGRPKRDKVLTDLAFDYLEKTANIKFGDIPAGSKKWKELMALGWLIHIVKGSGSHLQMFLDRMEGKIEQAVKVAGDSEEPISFTIKIDDNRDRDL